MVALGPIIGPWVAVALCALVGGLWTVGRVETESRLMAAGLLFRVVLTSCVLTGAVAALLSSFLPLSPDHALPLVAFCIACVGDKFNVIRERIYEWFLARMGGKS